MRHPIIVTTAFAGVVVLSASAQKNANETVERAFQDVNVVEETNLTDVMLTVADPTRNTLIFNAV